MKKYLIPVLICLALVVTMPGVALAKGKAPAPPKALTPFEAELTVTSIDDTVMGVNVFPVVDGSGTLIGWKGVLFTIFSSSALGTACGMIVMLNEKKGMKLAIPFGPFLSLGAIAYIFFGTRIVDWYLNLMR